MYVEKDGVSPYCVLPDEVESALDWAHDGRGHVGLEITLRNLYGRFWWPDRYRDVEKRRRACYTCAETANRILPLPPPRRGPLAHTA